jgi:hypothetical protein
MNAHSNAHRQAGFSHIVIPLAVIVVAGVVGTFFVVKSHASTCVDNSYRRGSKGTCVVYIQKLANYQLSTKLATDGSFGPLTQAGIKNLQAKDGLAVDGIVGPHTWYALCNPKYYVANTATVTFANLAIGAGCPVYTSGGIVRYN